jgi:hypothetical protein
MATHLRWFTLFLAGVFVVAPRPAVAVLVVNSSSIVCAGSGPIDGSAKVTRKQSTLTLSFKAKGLTPFTPVACGYHCMEAFSGGATASCGTADEDGKLSRKIELPVTFCYVLIPFFSAGGTGSCAPSAVP